MQGPISTGTVPAGLKPVYVHRQSRTLSQILAEMLLDLNNFTANQVFLEIGAHRLGGPVSLEKSLEVASTMLAAQGLAAEIHLVEGSGISRDDRFTARGLAKVLALFASHADLLHGHDGGMNKTGTMDGVRRSPAMRTPPPTGASISSSRSLATPARCASGCSRPSSSSFS